MRRKNGFNIYAIFLVFIDCNKPYVLLNQAIAYVDQAIMNVYRRFSPKSSKVLILKLILKVIVTNKFCFCNLYSKGILLGQHSL